MKMLLALASAALLPMTAQAASPFDFDFKGAINDDQYKELVQPIVNPMRHMFLNPAVGASLIGFDVGLAGTLLEVPAEARTLANTFVEKGADIPKSVILPRITAQVDAPFGLSVSGNFAMIPTTNVKFLGLGAQYEVGLPIPLVTLAARGAWSSLMGLEELSSTHLNVEGLVSAGLPPGVSAILDVEPYLGFGMDFASAKSDVTFIEPNTQANVEFSRSADWTETYVLAGARLSLAVFRIGAEAQISTTGQPMLLSAKAGVGF